MAVNIKKTKERSNELFEQIDKLGFSFIENCPDDVNIGQVLFGASLDFLIKIIGVSLQSHPIQEKRNEHIDSFKKAINLDLDNLKNTLTHH